MLEHESEGDDFWCPLGENGARRAAFADCYLSADERSVLSRFGNGEWISDAQIEHLTAKGLIEKAFGQALLTRLGRTAIGSAE